MFFDGGQENPYNARLFCSQAIRHEFPGQVAQLVEQRTENPRVDGSIPPLATISKSPNPFRAFSRLLAAPGPGGPSRVCLASGASHISALLVLPGLSVLCFYLIVTIGQRQDALTVAANRYFIRRTSRGE